MFKMFTRGVEALRQPDRSLRCYEIPEQEKIKLVREWNNRNTWNTPELAKEDTYYGA